jgi:hypothetical protein
VTQYTVTLTVNDDPSLVITVAVSAVDILEAWKKGERQARAILNRRARLSKLSAHAANTLPTFTCPVCGLVSYNPTDRAKGYCGACHAYTGAGTIA